MPRQLPVASALLLLVLVSLGTPARAASHWSALASGTTSDLLSIEDDIWGPPVGPWIVGAGGYAAFPNAARTTWTPFPLGTSADIHVVQQPGVQELWFGGDGGSVHFKYVTNLYGRDVPTSESVVLVTPGTTAPVAIGSGGNVYDGTVDGGLHWPLVHSAGVGLRAAIGLSTGVLMVGDQGTILFGNWAWTTWNTRVTGVTADLYAIAGKSPIFFAVGAGGMILRSADGGTSWSQVASPSSATLRSVSVSKVHDNVVVVVGDGGTVLKSSDAGLTWCVLDAGTTVDLLGVTALDDDKYIVAGRSGTLLSTADGGGPCVVTAGVETAAAVPSRLREPFPNPLVAGTTLGYSLRSRERVDLAVFDPAGRRVRLLASGEQDAGTHSAAWDGRDASGREVPAGLYFVRLHAGSVFESRRVVVAR